MQAKVKRVKYVMAYVKENINMNEHSGIFIKIQ